MKFHNWFNFFSKGYNEQLHCKHHEGNPNSEYCDYPPYFKHFHEEYYSKGDDFFGYATIEASDMFHCLNRMDQKDQIFSKKVFPIRLKGKKLSLLLNYTEEYFACGSDIYDWSYETLYNLTVTF